MMLLKTPIPPRIADDNDFQEMKKLVDEHIGWSLELDKSKTQVWTRSVPGCDFNMVKILSEFDDCAADVLFDVLHDPDYRKEWDSHMLASEEIGIVNVNNDVGYYAMSCPPPLKPRDFVLMRSWLDTGPMGEQMLLSRSVPHKNFPPRKGYIRAQSHITGFIIRTLTRGGCFLGYVAHCDPQGHLPPWLVNKVTHTLGPRMVRDLRKAALGYVLWKRRQANAKKPWRFPEEMSAPRILLEVDCVEPIDPNQSATASNSQTMKSTTRALSVLSVRTPTNIQQNTKQLAPPAAPRKSISAPTTPLHEQMELYSEKNNFKTSNKTLSKNSSFSKKSEEKLNKKDISTKNSSSEKSCENNLAENSSESTKPKSKAGKFKSNLLSFKKKKKFFGNKT